MMKKVKQLGTLSGLWKHRRELYNMFREMFKGTYRASFLTLLALVLGGLYIISPIDLIPDFIPIIGWVDDGIVFYFLLKRLTYELTRYHNSRSRLRMIR